MRINEILDLTALHSNPDQLKIDPAVKEMIRLSNLDYSEYFDEVVLPYARTVLKDETATDIRAMKYQSTTYDYLRVILWRGAGYTSNISNARFLKKIRVFNQQGLDKTKFVVSLMRFSANGQVIPILAIEPSDKYVEYLPTFVLSWKNFELLEEAITRIGVAKTLKRRPKELKKW